MSSAPSEEHLHRQNVVACIWDCDKTLVDGYMQTPIFEHYGIDEATFWDEVNALPGLYARRGCRVSPETVYLNHLLTCVRLGRLKGLSNARLREFGGGFRLYPGLPDLLDRLKAIAHSEERFRRHRITIEHYIISTGLAEMIRGNALAGHVDGVFASEFIESPVPPGFLSQDEFGLENGEPEISQIGFIVDNTIKTRFIFEINKGCNVDPEIDVNARIDPEDRRIPIRNMIYIADGPSDIPVFSVVKKNGGLTYAVYDPRRESEFEQNDTLLQTGRIHAYGPADYRPESATARWLTMHLRKICGRLCEEREYSLARRVSQPPRHLRDETGAAPEDLPRAEQVELME